MPMFTRRQFTALTAACALPAISSAQEIKPELARFLVPFPPGGTTDQIARALAEQIRGDVANTMIVENRPGAAGKIAIQGLKQFPPDGATMLIHALSIQSNYPHTMKQLGYDPFADIVALTTICQLEFCFAVGPAVPPSVKNLRDYLEWVKQDPMRSAFATPGPGNPLHFMPLMLGRAEKIELTPVHYRGTSAAVPDILGGQIPATSTPLNDALLNGQGGKIRILATSGAKRSRFTPDVPTFGEQGFPKLTYRDFYGVYVSAKTPAPLQQRLGDAARKAITSPAVTAVLSKLYLEPATSTAAEALQIARQDHELWGRVVKEVGYQPE